MIQISSPIQLSLILGRETQTNAKRFLKILTLLVPITGITIMLGLTPFFSKAPNSNIIQKNEPNVIFCTNLIRAVMVQLFKSYLKMLLKYLKLLNKISSTCWTSITKKPSFRPNFVTEIRLPIPY